MPVRAGEAKSRSIDPAQFCASLASVIIQPLDHASRVTEERLHFLQRNQYGNADEQENSFDHGLSPDGAEAR